VLILDEHANLELGALQMKTGLLAAVAGLAVSTMASATFTGYVVTSTNVTNSGQNLTVYTLWARFNGPTDTVLNAYNFAAVGGSALGGFWHKDNASYNSGVLQQEFGTWSPGQTGNATANRPFDSYLTIGNQAVGTNPTQADPSSAGSTRIRRIIRVALALARTPPPTSASASSSSRRTIALLATTA
jgi:hypothetical protein